MNTMMNTEIKTPEIKFDDKTSKWFFVGISPYIETHVSCTNGKYSLQGEDSYEEENTIGIFIGYPAKCDTEKLDYGFNASTGYIKVGDEITLSVCDGLVSEYVKPTPKNDSNEDILMNLSFLSPEKASCTPISTYVDTKNHLGFETSFDTNSICGVFFGEPGKYFKGIDSEGNYYSNRIYGFGHSTGTIILNNTLGPMIPYLLQQGQCEFSYSIEEGVVKKSELI